MHWNHIPEEGELWPPAKRDEAAVQRHILNTACSGRHLWKLLPFQENKTTLLKRASVTSHMVIFVDFLITCCLFSVILSRKVGITCAPARLFHFIFDIMYKHYLYHHFICLVPSAACSTSCRGVRFNQSQELWERGGRGGRFSKMLTFSQVGRKKKEGKQTSRHFNSDKRDDTERLTVATRQHRPRQPMMKPSGVSSLWVKKTQ